MQNPETHQGTGNFTWGLALTGLIALTGLATFCPFSVLWDVTWQFLAKGLGFRVASAYTASPCLKRGSYRTLDGSHVMDIEL